jgi:CRISPR-associated endonuclease Csn1
MQIAENIVLGFDLGIASIGWAIIDEVEKVILDAGVWTFNAPETDKEKTPKNQIRQAMRSMRRTIKHRRQRMNDVRDFLAREKLLPNNDKNIAHDIAARLKASPWQLRSEALKRKLTDEELGLVLYHIARHRGFQSNRKGGENAEAGEDQKALKDMQGLGQSIATYSTFGQALTEDKELSIRKRNISGDYGRTPKRDWLRQELSIITNKQNGFGGNLPTHIIEEFISKAFTQRPLQDVADRVANCPFEKDQKRSSKHAPSFEYFRFLQKLNHISLWMPRSAYVAPDLFNQDAVLPKFIADGGNGNGLSPEQIRKVAKEFGNQTSYTYKSLRKTLDLDPNVRFNGVSKDDESQDIVARKGNSAAGTRALKNVLSGLYDTADIAQLDDAMFAITFHESNQSVKTALEKLNLPQNIFDALMIGVENNAFKEAKGAAHISAKACRNIIKGLLEGKVYSEACEMAGYDHTAPDASPLVNLKKQLNGKNPSEIRKAFSALLSDKNQHLIGSPVAKKALIEAVKQFVAIVNNHNALGGKLPGKVHVEMARDVGKSAEERNKIKSGIEKRNKTLDNVAKDFKETFGREPRRGSNDLLTFELGQEQNWRCLYSDAPIDKMRVFDGMTYQIDHILPWSRFGDDSYANKTLCTARANQAKKHRTPVEWAQSGEIGAPNLDEYLARIEACKEMRGIKKRNYTLKNAKEVEERFRTRNLNDTRWACRLFLQSLDLFYEDAQMKNTDGKEIRRLYARPGSIIAKARQAWGVERLKKDENGKRREDDRHHAIDAITIAAMSESMLQALTKAHQQAESWGSARAFEGFEPPWPMFRDDVVTGIDKVLVARAEDRKVSGQKHMETVRALDEETGTVFERLTPEKLLDQTTKKADESKWHEVLSARFGRPERSNFVIEELLRWEREGRPQDKPPLATNRKDGEVADKIRKIRVIATGSKPAVRVRGGTADRGDMARVDVFSKANAKGKKQFYAIPIYPHNITNDEEIPCKACKSGSEDNWTLIDKTYDFEFSMHKKSWLEIVKSDGTFVEGYFRSLDISGGKINLSPNVTQTELIRSIGLLNLHSLTKFSIDRLGTKHKIEKEVRTWQGKPWDWPQ